MAYDKNAKVVAKMSDDELRTLLNELLSIVTGNQNHSINDCNYSGAPKTRTCFYAKNSDIGLDLTDTLLYLLKKKSQKLGHLSEK